MKITRNIIFLLSISLNSLGILAEMKKAKVCPYGSSEFRRNGQIVCLKLFPLSSNVLPMSRFHEECGKYQHEVFVDELNSELAERLVKNYEIQHGEVTKTCLSFWEDASQEQLRTIDFAVTPEYIKEVQEKRPVFFGEKLKDGDVIFFTFQPVPLSKQDRSYIILGSAAHWDMHLLKIEYHPDDWTIHFTNHLSGSSLKSQQKYRIKDFSSTDFLCTIQIKQELIRVSINREAPIIMEVPVNFPIKWVDSITFTNVNLTNIQHGNKCATDFAHGAHSPRTSREKIPAHKILQNDWFESSKMDYMPRILQTPFRLQYPTYRLSERSGTPLDNVLFRFQPFARTSEKNKKIMIEFLHVPFSDGTREKVQARLEWMKDTFSFFIVNSDGILKESKLQLPKYKIEKAFDIQISLFSSLKKLDILVFDRVTKKSQKITSSAFPDANCAVNYFQVKCDNLYLVAAFVRQHSQTIVETCSFETFKPYHLNKTIPYVTSCKQKRLILCQTDYPIEDNEYKGPRKGNVKFQNMEKHQGSSKLTENNRGNAFYFLVISVLATVSSLILAINAILMHFFAK